MNTDQIKKRAVELLTIANTSDAKRMNEVYFGTITLLHAIHGSGSPYERDLSAQYSKLNVSSGAYQMTEMLTGNLGGILKTMICEIDAGLLGSLRAAVTGEVLVDFLALSRATLESDEGDDAKNVAAVLAAAAYEDTIRRMAEKYSVPNVESLSDILIELKKRKIIEGTPFGIAQSYLNFRNNALHARWAKVDRPSVSSVLGFIQELIVAHFR